MLTSTPDRYGRVAVVLHWSIAVLILVALASGFAADNAGAGGQAPLTVHVIAGLLAAVLTLARLAWWLIADTRPASPSGVTPFQHGAARVVHALFYIIPLGIAASGIGMLVLSGAGAQLVSGAAAPLPDFDTLLPRTPHGLGARALIALIVLHVGAAILHHRAIPGGFLQRMT